MAEIKRISVGEFKDTVSRHKFDERLLAKDYYVTLVLYLLRDVEGLNFKGGTALNKIFLAYARLSEDVDYTVTKEIHDVRKQIVQILDSSRLFESITKDKDVHGFLRLIARYKDFNGREDQIFIDLNERAKLQLRPETHEIIHFYGTSIPRFTVGTLARAEMVAEKMAATIGRNKPRDHFDLYMIIKHRIPIDLNLVNKKCQQSNCEYDIVKMFNKAKTLKKRWDEDLVPLIAEEVSFVEVMKTLAKHFKLKDEKERQKSNS